MKSTPSCICGHKHECKYFKCDCRVIAPERDSASTHVWMVSGVLNKAFWNYKDAFKYREEIWGKHLLLYKVKLI